MTSAPQTQRVVFRGISDGASRDSVSQQLAAKLSASPQQLNSILSAPGYIVAKGLSPNEAATYVATLESCGAQAEAQDEALLLPVDLPEPQQVVLVPETPPDPAANLIRRIADYERASCYFWIGLGIVQLITIFGAIAGVWNIANAIAGLKTARRIRERDSTIPAEFESIGWYIVMGLVNLLLGGVIGVVFIGFDLFVRDKVLTNRHLFNRIIPKIDAYAAKKARREARLQRLNG